MYRILDDCIAYVSEIVSRDVDGAFLADYQVFLKVSQGNHHLLFRLGKGE